MKFLRVFEKVVHKTSRFFSWIAAGALFLMMMLTFIDVIGRYIFNYPIKGTQDLVELALVICVFGAMGHVTLARGHIRADMLNTVLSKRNTAILSAASFILSFVIAIPLTLETGSKAMEYLRNMNIITATISIPIGPFIAFATFGFIMMSIEIIFDVIAYIKEAGDPDNPIYSEKGIDNEFTCF